MSGLAQQLTRAASAFQQRQFDQAEETCRAILAQHPDQFDARHLLGLVLAESGQLDAALDELQKARASGRANPDFQRNYLMLLSRLKRWPEVLEATDQCAPDQHETRYLRAQALNETGCLADAESELEAVLVGQPGHSQGHALMAQLLEHRRRDDDALEHADRALEASQPPFMAGLVRARIVGRQDGVAEATGQLLSLLAQETNPINQALASSELGRLMDRSGQYDKAFAAYHAANRMIAGTDRARIARGNSVYSLESIAEMETFFTPERLSSWRREAPVEPDLATQQPAFLIGFPRSGTTLMDRILDAHSDVAVLEERPTLHDALSRFAQSEASWQELEQADEALLQTLRDRYHQRVSDELKGSNPVCVIDKLPLNLLFVGMIYKLFPGARLIFALRDPRDVCLSCFMQSFDINDAMSHFLALESTADYYRRVMTLGLRLLEHLPVRQHRLRYEDLIVDTEAEAQSLLEFLGLPWQDSVLRFFEHARGKHIDTPSYEQVTRPIYQSSAGRWKNYLEPLRPILPILAPLVEQLGYARAPEAQVESS